MRHQWDPVALLPACAPFGLGQRIVRSTVFGSLPRCSMMSISGGQLGLVGSSQEVDHSLTAVDICAGHVATGSGDYLTSPLADPAP